MGKLTLMIDEMLMQADKDPGEEMKRVLGGGLHVVIKSEKSAYVLILARKAAGPDEREMQTFFNHWPYKLPERPVVENGVWSGGREGWPALRCRIPRRLF